MTSEARLPAVGERVRLERDEDRYPHFIAPKWAEGVVTYSDADMYAVRLDRRVEGAEEWDNEVHWYPSNGDTPQVERI